MSSSITSRYLRVYRSAVHPLLSILLPFLFLASTDQLLRVIFPLFPFFPAHLEPLLLAAGIEEAAMGNLLFKERASLIARVRELGVLLCLAFAYLLILSGLRSGRLHVSPLLIYPLTAVMLQWLLSGSFHAALREREILLGALTGRRGSELRHSLRESSYQAGLTVRVLRGIRTAVLVFQSSVVAQLIAVAALGRMPSLAAGLAALLHAAGGLMALGLLHMFEEEQLLLGSGLAVPLRFERRRAFFCLSLLAAAAALAALVARNASVLPLSALVALLRRLASLFRFPAFDGMADALRNTLLERQSHYSAMFRSRPPPAPVSPLAILLVELLRRLVITLLGTALFLFVVSPLLSADFVARLRELKPLGALAKKLEAFFAFLARARLRLLRMLGRSRRPVLPRVEDERRESAASKPARRFRGRLSIRKRLQMSRVQRAFAALIKRGEELGIPFLLFYTPREYAERLSGRLPAAAGRLAYAVEVFEEAMFSTHVIAPGRISRYYHTVRRLRRLAPPAGT
jgi:hypothetical protein